MKSSYTTTHPSPMPPAWAPSRVGALLVILVVGLTFGCDSSTTRRDRRVGEGVQTARGEDLFATAVGTLNRLEEFETGEMLSRSVARLDQWMREQDPLEGWTLDPLAEPWIRGIGQFGEPLEAAAEELSGLAGTLALKDLVTQIEATAPPWLEVAAQLESLQSQHDLQALDSLAANLRKLAGELEGPPQLRGTALLEFIDGRLRQIPPDRVPGLAKELENASADSSKMEAFVELDTLDERVEGLLQEVAAHAARLKEIAEHSGSAAVDAVGDGLADTQDELRDAFDQRSAEALRPAIAGLETRAGELDKVARRRDAASLRALAPLLGPLAEQLDEAATRMGTNGEELGLYELVRLAAEVDRLGRNVGDLADDLEGLPAEGGAAEFDSGLHAASEQLTELSRQLGAIVAPIRYFAEVGDLAFPDPDGYALQQAVWLRDVSEWVVGEERDTIRQAVTLFDWVVRNIQLDSHAPEMGSDGTEPILQKPWETLLFGHGTASEQAWLFVLLARQRGIDAVVVGLKESDSQGAEVAPWVTGVMDQGELYLFDTTLGLPIPAPDGLTLDEDGSLEIRPATLSQVAADDALLRRLDLDEDRPYPVSAEQLENVVALVEAGPASLTQRMAIIERQLPAKERMVLTADPTGQADRASKCGRVEEARLWAVPYATRLQAARVGDGRALHFRREIVPLETRIRGVPALAKGRILHIKGRFEESPTAAEFYQAARVPDSELSSIANAPTLRAVYSQTKWDATYWLGLVAAEQNNWPAAIDYFLTRVLDATPNGPWTHGASYNLARVYESDGKTQWAIERYITDTLAPNYHGNILRARWLAALASPAPRGADSEGKPTESERAMPPIKTPDEDDKNALPSLPGLEVPDGPKPALPGLPGLPDAGSPPGGDSAEDKAPGGGDG